MATGMNAVGSGIDRNPALDFAKGTLVLLMILYHWINYFVSTQGFIYTYLRFITPSFIFIAGFLITNIYPIKYGWGNPRVYERLVGRGVKILALFTVLNVSANVMFADNYNGAMPGVSGFLNNAASIYLSGSGKASFYVLVPISYLLLLSSFIFFTGQGSKYLVHLCCAVVFLSLALLRFYDHSSPNLEMVGVGLLGMVLGLYPVEKVNGFLSHSWVLLWLNLGYILAITVWGVVYLLQVVGVCLSVMLIYLIGVKSVCWERISVRVNLLGRYSLFGYVVQILVLQLLHRGLSHAQISSTTLWIVSFVGAFALTIMLVSMMDLVRRKSEVVDKLYTVAFS